MLERTRIDDRTVVITPGRVLDSNNATEMSEAIEASVCENFRSIIVNMRDLEVISSAGVGAILGSLGALRAREGDIVLCNVREMVRHIFEVLDLCDYIVMESSEEAALSHCARPK
jgi:anti-anti-sigma factor